MSLRSWTDQEVLDEAERLVAQNVGNAKVRAFAREVLRLRDELERVVKLVTESGGRVQEREAIVRFLENVLPREFKDRESKLALSVAVNAIRRKEHLRP